MSDDFDDMPVLTEYRAQYIERNGREPKWLPTRYAKVGNHYRRVWMRNHFHA